jgi:hypothetical protein
MGRTAIAIGTKVGGPCVMDRLASRFFSADEETTGDSAVSPARTGLLLQHATLGNETCSPENASDAEAEIIPPALWSQLSLPERQRFGHRFSFMVLKALGLRPCASQEVEI